MTARFDHTAAQQDAEALILYFGMDAVLRREGVADRPCRVAIISYDPHEKATSLTELTDRRVIMSAANVEVQAMPPDKELDQLVTFVQPPATPPVVHEILPFTCPVKPTAPAGVIICYEFTVRR